MRQIKKIIISMLLAFICLSPLPVCAEDAFYVEVTCGGNLFNNFKSLMVVQNDELFICINDAAKASGYEVKDINDDTVTFARSGEDIQIKTSLYDDTNYVNFVDAMNALNVEVKQIDDAFYLRGLECTKKELYQLTDDIVQGFTYKVMDSNTSDMKKALAGSILYDLIIKAGIFSYKTYTDYYGDTYKSIFKDFIEADTSEAYLLNKDFNQIEKIIKNMDTIDKSELKDPSEVIESILYPNGEIKKEVLDKINNSGKIKGFDLNTQLKIYDYTKAIIDCNETNADMVKYTFDSTVINEKYVPDSFTNVVKDFISVNKNENKIVYYDYYVKEELDSIIDKSLSSTSEEVLKTIIPGYKTFKIGAWLTDFIANEYYDFSDTTDYVKKAKCISELQTGLYSIYNTYRVNTEKAVNTKYTAMMFVRCMELWMDAFSKVDDSNVNNAIYGSIDRTIGKLMNIPNKDLTFKPNNKIELEPISKNKINLEEYKKRFDLNKFKALVDEVYRVGYLITPFNGFERVDKTEEYWSKGYYLVNIDRIHNIEDFRKELENAYSAKVIDKAISNYNFIEKDNHLYAYYEKPIMGFEGYWDVQKIVIKKVLDKEEYTVSYYGYYIELGSKQRYFEWLDDSIIIFEDGKWVFDINEAYIAIEINDNCEYIFENQD